MSRLASGTRLSASAFQFASVITEACLSAFLISSCVIGRGISCFGVFLISSCVIAASSWLVAIQNDGKRLYGSQGDTHPCRYVTTNSPVFATGLNSASRVGVCTRPPYGGRLRL